MSQSVPVFIHAWFRSSSTFVWERLRRNEAYRCYYEPLNEELPLWTPTLLLTRNETAFPGDGHPRLERPYFFEYYDLIEDRQLRFDPAFSYLRYWLAPNAREDRLRDYLARLIADAERVGKRPILCFCRSQMRSLWMRTNLGGLHIGQVRGLVDQWRSFGRHEYFNQRLFDIGRSLLNATNPADPLLQRIFAPAPGNIEPPMGTFPSFVLVWLASLIEVATSCDVLVDVDRLSADPVLRGRTEADLRDRGVDLDLGDLNTPASNTQYLGDPVFQQIFAGVLTALGGPARKLLPADLGPAGARIDHFHPTTAAVVRRALEALST